MTELSGISGSQKLISKPRVSLETTQKQPPMEATTRATELQNLEVKMEQINKAFILVQEIKTGLESALRNL